MPHRSLLAVSALVVALALTGCASGGGGPAGAPGATGGPSDSGESAAPSTTTDAAALERAQAWLDAAVLPPGAVRSEESVGDYNSYTGWPCRPVEELEAFWTIADTTVPDAANWLMEHPTADLMTTAVGPVSDDPAISSAIVGYIPERDSQEGIVYTVVDTAEGVAVRAEVAALTETATCPSLPPGGMHGAPGQG